MLIGRPGAHLTLLLDHNVNRRFRECLPGHDVTTTREMRWEQLSNGTLLARAAVELFDAVIALDKKIEYEQNLKALPVAIIVLDAPTSSIHSLAPFGPFVMNLLKSPLDRLLYFVEPTGNVIQVTSPRPK